jgi:DNA polymerase-3 subunit delta
VSISTYLVCGDDDYLIDVKARALVNELVPPAERALGLEIIEGRAQSADDVVKLVKACLASVQTAGLFGGAKLTWLRDAGFLAGSGRSFESDLVKEAIAQLTALVKGGLPEGQRLLVTACGIPRNSALFKAFQAAGGVTDFGAAGKPWEQAGQAIARVRELLPGLGLTMDAGVCAEFVERAGFNTRLLVQELEKLRAYVGPKGAVQAADVRAIVSISHAAEANDLTTAVGERKLKEMIPILRRLFDQGESGIKLAVMVEGRVRDMLVMREALDRKWISVRQKGSMPSAEWLPNLPPEAEEMLAPLDPDPRTRTIWQLGRPAAQAQNYTLTELRRARHLLIELREKLVSSSLPEAFLVETTLLKILVRPPRPRST